MWGCACWICSLISFLIYPTREIGGVTVWGAGLGVTGAALGTGAGPGVYRPNAAFPRAPAAGAAAAAGGERWRFTRPCMRSALQLATPAALERLALCLAQIVMTAVVTGMGPVAVAANYVAVQTESICYLPDLRHRDGGDGPRRPEHRRGAAGYGQALCLRHDGPGLWAGDRHGRVAVLAGAGPIGAADAGGGEVIDLSARALRIVAFSEPLFAVSIVAIGALRGQGTARGRFSSTPSACGCCGCCRCCC